MPGVLALADAGRLWAQTAGEWTPLFDGRSLAGWRKAGFTGEGPVLVKDGSIQLGLGGPMTGVTRLQSLPGVTAESVYEVQYEAARVQGGDFFASLTFPAGGSHCTLVTGGWGGDIVGISSIDGWDASDNETRSYFTFAEGQWYRFRVVVSPEKILAWIDEQPVVNVVIRGRAISLRRGEMDRSVPFGFAAYNTAGAIRGVRYRVLRAAAK